MQSMKSRNFELDEEIGRLERELETLKLQRTCSHEKGEISHEEYNMFNEPTWSDKVADVTFYCPTCRLVLS
jgi:hypothetical protein